MEFMLGTEPRREYYAFEAAAAAHKMLSEVMLVKPDETVVIIADTQSDWAGRRGDRTSGPDPESSPNGPLE